MKKKKEQAGIKEENKKSILVVISGKEASEDIKKALRNLSGVDVSHVRDLNAEIVAPGTHPGRLTIWTESSIKTFLGKEEGEM